MSRDLAHIGTLKDVPVDELNDILLDLYKLVEQSKKKTDDNREILDENFQTEGVQDPVSKSKKISQDFITATGTRDFRNDQSLDGYSLKRVKDVQVITLSLYADPNNAEMFVVLDDTLGEKFIVGNDDLVIDKSAVNINKLKDLITPTDDYDAANKLYVDTTSLDDAFFWGMFLGN